MGYWVRGWFYNLGSRFVAWWLSKHFEQPRCTCGEDHE